MKKSFNIKATVAVLTAVSVLLAGLSVTVFAGQSEPTTDKNVNDGVTTTSRTASNDQTVYILTDPSGGEYQRIVSAKGTLYYDGYEECTLPVTEKVSYTLDGKTITPEDLKGQSGHVVMTISYTNNVQSNGVYVPFLAVTGMVLDNESFSNIAVTNGKAVDDGNRNIVVGYALPGMSDNLGAAGSSLGIPESVTVSADVENFNLNTMYTFVTADVFSGMNISSDMDLSDLTGQIGRLTDGLDSLMTGTGQIYDGAAQLKAGASRLTEGTDELKAGANDLNSGLGQLKDGSSYLTSKLGEASEGAAELSDGLTSFKTEGMDKLSGSMQLISGSSQNLRDGASQIAANTLASANKSVAGAGIPTLTADNYQQILDGAIAGSSDDAAKMQLETLKTTITSVLEYKAGIDQYTAGVDNAAAAAVALDGDENLGKLAAGAKQLSESLPQLTAGASTLSQGINDASSGSEKLFGGMTRMRVSENELVSGIDRLYAGSRQLKDGVNEMAEQIENKLSMLSDIDIQSILDSVNAMTDASKSYKSWGDTGNYNSVKFIYKTDEISTK